MRALFKMMFIACFAMPSIMLPMQQLRKKLYEDRFIHEHATIRHKAQHVDAVFLKISALLITFAAAEIFANWYLQER